MGKPNNKKPDKSTFAWKLKKEKEKKRRRLEKIKDKDLSLIKEESYQTRDNDKFIKTIIQYSGSIILLILSSFYLYDKYW